MSVLRRMIRLRSVRLALLVLAVVAVLAVAGGSLAPQDPIAQDPKAILQNPSGAHWLGTDYLGRDVLSRLMDATGRSVVGAAEAVGVGLLLGAPAGLASVVFGRAFEWLALRISDALLTLPYIIFAIAVTGIIGNGIHQAMLAIGLVLAPNYFRITRAATLGLASSQYVEIAELVGASRWWILRTHIWNKVLPTIVVTAASGAAASLLVVSSLSFLGIGTKPPAPTWGGMLSSDLNYLAQRPWAPLAPSLVIIITVAALNALADALRDTTGIVTGDPGGSGRARGGDSADTAQTSSAATATATGPVETTAVATSSIPRQNREVRDA
ncbi:peptide/nickel transport system permease protein [Parafrankia irregularis]|uniref:Peptide/nickel transport system permease protein n=1 Tax=Parafrankia irregularis TaxID=795642 RepID=A0A0S4QSF2_9ACTN|nr:MULTISPECIES: ABC transporter permease [Parafrankia]MBE3199862.1 ABC transporter permease [Parafrankia sp. CH37]CUU58014.1 peptide/nickel transport system permease protein [Parafrankia irregularis]